MSDLLLDIAEAADELTNPKQNVERIRMPDGHKHLRFRRVWIVTLPSLLDQLAAAVVPGEVYMEEDPVNRASYASKPAARLDAVDRLLTIEANAALWCQRSQLPLRDDAAGNIRAMVGFAPTLGSDLQKSLLGDLRAWRSWAATVTGWERPPDAPRAPCPFCAKRNTLRVRLAKETGCCMACGAAWDETNIGLLAEHIRSYAQAKADTRQLRTKAVLARREEEAKRSGHATPPDLPYIERV